MAEMTPVQPEIPPVVVTSAMPRGPKIIVLVGAGGNGARVISPLSQILRDGDQIAIFDNDIVEDRNLRRQMFIARDIGQHKATVLAARYRRPTIATHAFTTRISEAAAPTFATDIRALQATRAGDYPTSIIIMGCVDNAAARRSCHALVNSLAASGAWSGSAWIDVGNEMRGGQVLMTLRHWPCRVNGASATNITIPALSTAMPQLLLDTPWTCGREGCGRENVAGALICAACQQPVESCGERIDLQTVMVNMMAATSAINCLSWLLNGMSFTSCGAFFSTLNTMQPIRLASYLPALSRVDPETSFAVSS